MKTTYIYLDGNYELHSKGEKELFKDIASKYLWVKFVDDGVNVGYNVPEEYSTADNLATLLLVVNQMLELHDKAMVVGLYDHVTNIDEDCFYLPDNNSTIQDLVKTIAV